MFEPKLIKDLPKDKLFCYRIMKENGYHDLWGRKISNTKVAVHILAKIVDDNIEKVRIEPTKRMRVIKISPDQEVWA